jgi:hypothetical protein
MQPVTFETFDPTPYQRVPITNTNSTLTLGRALAELMPSAPNAQVAKAGKRLATQVGIVEDALTDRRREQSPAEYGTPVVFDGATDGLWNMCYGNLQAWHAYEHPGLDVITAKPETELGASVAKSRLEAERARALSERLFGNEGLAFLRAPFREQVESTGAILRLISEDGLAGALGELVGVGLVADLYGIQELYEGMVVDQLASEPGGVENLRELRLGLIRVIGRYCIAVLGMLDEDEPESLGIVIAALRPVVVMRELTAAAARRRASGAGGGEDVELVEGVDVVVDADADADAVEPAPDEPEQIEA